MFLYSKILRIESRDVFHSKTEKLGVFNISFITLSVAMSSWGTPQITGACNTQMSDDEDS